MGWSQAPGPGEAKDVSSTLGVGHTRFPLCRQISENGRVALWATPQRALSSVPDPGRGTGGLLPAVQGPEQGPAAPSEEEVSFCRHSSMA